MKILSNSNQKLKNKLIFWKRIGLSLLGRIEVLNTYILFRLWYRIEFQKITKEIEINLHNDILDFIWGKKKHQISEAALNPS